MSSEPAIRDVSSPEVGTHIDLLGNAPTPLVVSERDYTSLTAREEVPGVFLGLGIVFALGPSESEATGQAGGVLEQAGFQLDVGGMHKMSRHVSRAEKRRAGSGRLRTLLATPALYFTGRVGLNANQEQIIGTDDGSGGAAGQVDAALQQADEIALTAKLDAAWPLLGSPSQEIAMYASGGLSYARVEPYVFPDIPVGDTARPADQVFTPATMAQVTERFGSTVPVGEYGYGLMLRSIRDEQIAFYIGGGLQSREVLIRTLRFDRDDARTPLPSSLQG